MRRCRIFLSVETVCETRNYLSRAKSIGMSRAEMDDVISFLSVNPMAGDMIVGSGGCRKVRVAGRGKGKSGGYRVVTFWASDDGTVYLLAVLSKGDDANFSSAEIKAMYDFVKAL